MYFSILKCVLLERYVKVAVLHTSYNDSEPFGEENMFIELELWWESEAAQIQQ